MTTPVPERLMTIEEFLELPEEKPYREFLRGVCTRKEARNYFQGRLVAELIYRLAVCLQRSREGHVLAHVLHYDPTLDWAYLPDVEVRLMSRPYLSDPVEACPDFAIEVLSPRDRASFILERVELYMRAGTTLLWLVDPEREAITAYVRGEEQRVFRAGAMIDARPVLKDFSLDVGALFERVRTA